MIPCHTTKKEEKLKKSASTKLFKKAIRFVRFCKGANICVRCLLGTAHVLILLLLFSPNANAEIPQALAVKAIVGEAANQGVDGMTAVAEAIRNRGTLNGVYGLKRESFISSQPKWVHDQARQAWKRSETTNLVKGADHWENVEAFGVPYWAKSMQVTAKIKDHTFYRRQS